MPGDVVGYTLSVVFAPPGSPATIIDPGWESDGALSRVSAFLASIGRRLEDVGTVINTHSHPDHSGLAMRIRERTGAEVQLHVDEQQSIDTEAVDPVVSRERLGEWGVPEALTETLLTAVSGISRQATLKAQRLLRDGDEVTAGGRTLQIVHTPGHTPGHICLVSADEEAIFTGDLVLPTVFPGLGLGSTFAENPLSLYLRSLERACGFDELEVVPGHGYRFRGLADRSRTAADYMLGRAVEVRSVVESDPGLSVFDLAARLTWRAGWERLANSVTLAPALRQVAHYRDFVDGGGLEEFAQGLTNAR